MKKRSFLVFSIFADIAILALSFLFMVRLKPASLTHYLPAHMDFFFILAGLWLVVSYMSGKMYRGRIINLKSLFYRTIISNLLSLSIAVFLMVALDLTGHSRMIMFGTAALATFLELLTGTIYLSVQKTVIQDYLSRKEYLTIKELTEQEMVGETDTEKVDEKILKEVSEEVRKALIAECGKEEANGILNIAMGKLNSLSRILSTDNIFNIAALPEKEYSYIINLRRINNIKNLDKFLDAVNHKVKPGGNFMCCVETKNLRKSRILRKYPPVLNYIYYTFDFILKRVFPKIRITKWLYLLLTKGNNVVISRPEALGRLARAGFKIEAESFINNFLYIEGHKTMKPLPINGKNYGVLIALPRIGKGGDMIKVYKLRTMHPYSEYIQDYVYDKHELQEGGKFKNDYRITTWGAFARTIWLDELPMLINWLKGNMKMVGVRPLSKQYFNLYDIEMQEKRIRFKPGLIPPFYYDMPTSLDEIQASELKYLEAYAKHPSRTDFRYFFVSIWNILFRKARSK